MYIFYYLSIKKIVGFFILLMYFSLSPSLSKAESLIKSSWAYVNSNNLFSSIEYVHPDLGNTLGAKLNYNNKNVSSNLVLNINKKRKLSFDNSSFNLNIKNTILGIGKVNRHWSFSPNTSLILSKNARPSNSIYLTTKNSNSSNKLLSWVGPWSFEVFNSYLSNTNGPKNSMMLGARTVIEPINGLKFELNKISQWGGEGQSNSFNAFRAAMMGNTNEYSHANINQMAGIGVSYLIPNKKTPVRLYGQLIGEDEAGGLPSCYIYLTGLEWTNPRNNNNKIGIEVIDTRVDLTTHNNCGPNTAYNNNVYNYTNYDKVMGAPIDTESKSLNLWGSYNVSPSININYSLKDITINDTDYSGHRLSSTRKNGLLGATGISWQKNNAQIKSNISYKNFNLNKTGIKNRLSFSLLTIFNF